MPAGRNAPRTALDWLWLLTESVPAGRVTTYGQLGRLCGLTARQVGRALAGVPPERRIPWHRVINAAGRISLPADQGGARQQQRLLDEGVVFSRSDAVSLKNYGWPGPGPEWWMGHGLSFDEALERLARALPERDCPTPARRQAANRCRVLPG